MYDDPKPDDTVQGANGKICTVREFNAMTREEKLAFVGREVPKTTQSPRCGD